MLAGRQEKATPVEATVGNERAGGSQAKGTS